MDALTAATHATLPFDAVVSDVAMPGLPGPALAKAVRELHPDTAVLLVSGYIAEFAVYDTLATPSSAFLATPLTPLGLRAALDALLAARRTTAP